MRSRTPSNNLWLHPFPFVINSTYTSLQFTILTTLSAPISNKIYSRVWCGVLLKGKISINAPAVKQNPNATLAPIPMLNGSRSHENDSKPMIANKKPRKVRKTQREWHRNNSSIGTFVLLKGPTCTKRGLVDQMVGFSGAVWTLTRPRGFVVRTPLAWGLEGTLFVGSLAVDIGESIFSCSTSSSSRSATSSLYRMRKNAPRKDITAANEINCHLKAKMVKGTYMQKHGLLKHT